MESIQKAVLIGHTLIALLIIILVLMQRGKGADAGAAFGAGASGTVFGARGSSNFFSRATAVCATAFFISSLALAYLSSQSSSAPESLLEDTPAAEVVTDPEELPAFGDETPESDLPTLEPALEPVDESTEMPAIEEPEADGQE